jgi:hypothetical protein
MQRHKRNHQQSTAGNGGYFPRIARGHDWRCYLTCAKAKQGEAHYNDKGQYVDGHFTDQATAQRAHEEGHR